MLDVILSIIILGGGGLLFFLSLGELAGALNKAAKEAPFLVRYFGAALALIVLAVLGLQALGLRLW